MAEGTVARKQNHVSENTLYSESAYHGKRGSHQR